MYYIDDIDDVVKILNDDGIIVFPTDTIWGIGCDVRSPVAYHRIIKLKGRKPDKPFILLVDSVEHLKQYIPKLHPRLETLLQLHVKPLTIIYEKNIGLPEYALAKDGSIGIRIVQDDFCREVIRKLDSPIVSTSANLSGYPFPGNFHEIRPEIIDGVDFVSQYRRDEKERNEPSVVAKVNKNGELFFLRN